MQTIETRIPARLDRLPWSRWHLTVLIGLGTVWILDGVEVTIIGSISARLTEDGSGLALTNFQISQAAAIYVAGACCGALFFGQLTERFGRRKLFMVTLGVYLAATTLTAFSDSYLWFAVCRFFTGSGIGGEYAAINSAIDELIPARVRGRVDLLINGSYWLGTAFGAALAVVALDTDIFAADVGWRLAFGIGAVLGLVILLVRRNVPESPRWLLIHGREKEAEEIVGDVEATVEREDHLDALPAPDTEPLRIEQRATTGFGEIAHTLFRKYPKRTLVGFSLFVGQAFLYNAVTFDLGGIMSEFYGVDSGDVPWFLVAFGVGNFLGPLVLGPLFDTVGRRRMVAGCYVLSGVLLLVTGVLFLAGALTAISQIAAFMVVFFFASAGASSAYLTVSEIFPMETRALAIAFFYAIGTAAGGITGPLLFGALIDTGEVSAVFWGFAVGAVLMAGGGAVQWVFGVEAAGKDLESIAPPLSARRAGAPAGASAGVA